MPLPFAQLGASDLYRLALTLPLTGIWHADVEMSVDVPLMPGPQALVFAGTTYACSVVRTTDFAGVRSVRLVGGTGGWRTVVPPKPYASPAGVPTQVVLADVAATVLEIPPVVAPTVPPTLGTAWTRPGDYASVTLNATLGESWWMDPTGTVQSAPRVPLPILTPFEATAVMGTAGIYEIATEFPADWTPGKLFVGVTVQSTINRVMHMAQGSRLRTEVVASP